MVGTSFKQLTKEHQARPKKNALTHHQSLDILNPRVLDRLPQQEHANRRPHEQQAAKRGGDKPVEGRQVERPAKDDVQRWCVDDENTQARAREDPHKVEFVADDVLAKGEREFGLDGEHLGTSCELSE